MAAQNRGVGADGGAAAHASGAKFVFLFNEGAGIGYVSKDAARPQKNFCLDLDALVNRDVVLHLYAVADAHVFADEDILPEGAIASDARAGRNVDEMPHLGAAADFYVFIDDCGRMNKRLAAFAYGVFTAPVAQIGLRQDPLRHDSIRAGRLVRLERQVALVFFLNLGAGSFCARADVFVTEALGNPERVAVIGENRHIDDAGGALGRR